MKRYLAGLAALFLLPLCIGNALAQTNPTPIRPARLAIDAGTKTAMAISGAATLNKAAGVVTTEALTTAAAASYILTLTNAAIAAADQVFVSVAFGTGTTGVPVVTRVTPSSGSVVIVVRNIDASAAFNGTLKVAFAVLKN